MHPLETYLRDLSEAHSAGVPETTHYPALRALLNEIGGTLKPRVRCVINPNSKGAGIPDGGLYTPDQLPKGGDPEPPLGTLPARGAIEAKSTTDDVFAVAKSEQIGKYLKLYRQVLITNLRDFVLVVLDGDGGAHILESYKLAIDEESFWSAAAHPQAMATRAGERFSDFIKRVMLHPAPLASPKEVAWFLASYAREARWRIENHPIPALASLREALEQALGLKFEGAEGEHFFRSTLVQTLFYGAFAAWVLWSKEHPFSDLRVKFNWKLAGDHLHVPIVGVLFHQLIEPTQLKALGIDEVLDWAGEVLNRVDRGAFFQAFEAQYAVQYFYEPFLEAYDHTLRKQLGVWYTPPEIVTYMVERVDSVLRSELGIADGLADQSVVVLDPCCGTGSYVVEVLRRIEKTLIEKGKTALTANAVKKAAMERIFGFEIMPAPYVISHLQVGIALQHIGAPLSEDANERASVYLTNSLTGWEPPTGPKQHIIAFPQLEQERDAAEEVKRKKPIIVILGNPPYNAFAGVSPAEEMGLVEPYKEGLVKEWKIKKFNLDDLYVRFFRIAERRITDGNPGTGIVAFISNFSYIEDASFVVMRKRLLSEFDRIWIDCMNGDSRETGKLTPDGKPDPSVFSTEYNHEGIRVGTAIGVMARADSHAGLANVGFREFWGISKRKDLIDSLSANDFEGEYLPANPEESNRYSFIPSKVSAQYSSWPLVPELAQRHFNGPVERRGLALISMDRKTLAHRIQSYFDRSFSDEEIRQIYPSLMMTGNRIVGPDARKKILAAFDYDPSKIVPYPIRPLDTRWCYLENLRPLFSEPSPELLEQRKLANNAFFVTRDTADKSEEGPPFFFSPFVTDYDAISGHARHFPVFIASQRKISDHTGQHVLFRRSSTNSGAGQPNLSERVLGYLSTLGFSDSTEITKRADLIWVHALAIGFSPSYLSENADGVRRDWPRIPLPDSEAALIRSGELGRQIATLLDTGKPVVGVTNGAIRSELKEIAVISRESGGSLEPSKGHLALTAGWGHAGKDAAVMPGQGLAKVRDYTQSELTALEIGAKKLGKSSGEFAKLLGEQTTDIYLNNVAYWKNIPASVWEYTIGGYQVIKKWLSYREHDLLGRDLSADEIDEVTSMARRIAAIILLERALDANYEAVKGSTYEWPSTG